ncbi:6-bladed beta-propeller [Longimicrobium sp.]|uniref:6-bladed beta-propeller n=1 Tax=Longimicrobium sp. TaxID=2029185 RepID=UPI003B3A1FEA
MRRIETAFALLLVWAGAAPGAMGQPVPSRPITFAARDAPTLELTQVVRLGSMDGEHDAFGRVMDAALDRAGRILVADDQSHHVRVFGRDGRYVGTIGRRGRGPGEFESPWRVATDASDSIFVWDVAQARISVFGGNLRFARSFGVPPHWVVSSIRFLPDGRLLLAAYGRNERGTLHVLSRTGQVQRTFGPGFNAPALSGFESSLLGGSAEVTGGGIVYSVKSPYELWFFGLDGTPHSRCQGQREWTTSPASVVETGGGRTALNWDGYTHSYNVVSLGNGLYLNLVLDPESDRTTMDVITADCRLLRRTVTQAPLMVLRTAGSRMVAVRNLEYPEVLVYEQRLVR